MSDIFIGRQKELEELRRCQKRRSANLVIITGRRRIGKSRLIEEFTKNQHYYQFVGMAPTKGMTAQMQRDNFARQLSEQLAMPKFSMSDWGDLMTLLANSTSKGKVVILFDEISWMGTLDPSFLGKLKTAWDTQFKKNSRLLFVLCGSVSSWIEKNIISNTEFLGRPSLYMNIKELDLEQCNKFWGKYADRMSPYEKLKILSVTGGIPRYLELISPQENAENNITALCFSENAPLLNEFKRIFSDIFGKRSSIYKKIIFRLLLGPATQHEIIESTNRVKSGDFSDYLEDLEAAGFVSRDYSWNLENGNTNKLSKYRLKDNYIRFYLKYIQPNTSKIKKGIFGQRSIASLPGWDSIMGLQFENLVLSNTKKIIKLLGIKNEEVINAGPYFHRKTQRRSGCQIDLLIQTKFNCLYICEIKFSKTELSLSICQEMQYKIDILRKEGSFSFMPILIHVNGIKQSVIDSEFFYKIINFGNLVDQ